jgi:transposase, IS30 family
MGDRYSQLGLKERHLIDRLHADGLSKSQIAARMGRHKATIGRELAHNGRRIGVWPGGYDPDRAQGLAVRRRAHDKRFKLVRQQDLAEKLKQHLAMGLSPEQFVGLLTLEAASTMISHESIYRFIAHRIAQKDYSWHQLLPRQKYYRGRRPKKGGAPSRTFKDYVSIDQRPDDVHSRKIPGHWEADLMAFQNNQAFLLIVHERTSRKTFAIKQPDKTAQAAKISLCTLLGKLPRTMRRSITYDNGTEFAQHHLVNQSLKTNSYFCHTHSPWEKGGVENSIGRLRRHLPRKTDINALSQNDIDAIIQRHNQLPRKCLGFLTPNQAFDIARKSKTVALQT